MEQIQAALMESFGNLVQVCFDALVASIPIVLTIFAAIFVVDKVTKVAKSVSTGSGGGWSSNYNGANPDSMIDSSENDPNYDWW